MNAARDAVCQKRSYSGRGQEASNCACMGMAYGFLTRGWGVHDGVGQRTKGSAGQVCHGRGELAGGGKPRPPAGLSMSGAGRLGMKGWCVNERSEGYAEQNVRIWGGIWAGEEELV